MREIILLGILMGTFCIIAMIIFGGVNFFIAKDEGKYKNMISITGIKKLNKEICEQLEKKRKAEATLKNVGVSTDPVDILKLLEDRTELDKVLKRLNLKAFW